MNPSRVMRLRHVTASGNVSSKESIAGPYLISGLLIGQAILIIAFLFWLRSQSQANPFMEKWLSQNFPAGLFLLSDPVVLGISALLLGGVAVLIARSGGRHLVKRSIATSRWFEKVASVGFRSGLLYAISGIGLLVLSLGAIRSSISLVLVGFGLLFWGSLALPAKSSAIMREVDDISMTSISKTMNKLLEGLNLQKEPLYSPRRTEPGAIQVSIVVPHAPSATSLPPVSRETVLRQIYLLPTPGEGLTRIIENKLGLDFSSVPLSKVPELLKAAIVDKLRLADDFEYSSAGPIFHFRVFGCPYAKLCKDVSEISHVASHIGCAFCSMIASALVKASVRSVSIESAISSPERGVMDLAYRVFDDEERLRLVAELSP